jgi:hypothetical protein
MQVFNDQSSYAKSSAASPFGLFNPMDGSFGHASIEIPAHSPELAAHVHRALCQGIIRVADGKDHFQHLFAIKL